MRIKPFIIHLARATQRHAQVQKLRTRLGPDSEIIAAVDGSTLSRADLAAAYQPVPQAPRYPFALRPGEVGCFLSHRRVWTALLESDADAALVVEDDVELSMDFEAALSLAQRNLDALGYIQLQTRDYLGSEIDRQDGYALIRPQLTPLRTSAQLVSRAAAKSLLDISAPFDRPVDSFLQMHWHTGIHLAVISPACVIDRTAETGGSTIGTSKPLLEKLQREWKRARYRARIKRLSSSG
ncbi:glycosyltransferase family 25 protein [Parasedimentitalea psychrophila]|uniref:Glycosyltransferase family 25 protein n=1 Tax=Parasedimentitalea psychrophila TaxID=2997337 RepID=A0A9Y2P8F5_9RHOB|nr:glycosyltransferase family 25 protein [Parasedimentitalea psychrophila]WIY27018.1 glycosyltransferase family 25 protein [Parasedimentitalea psychrophila]